MPGAWPAGLPTTLTYPEAGIGAIVAGSARRYSDRTAFVDGDISLTYSDLQDHALRAAAGLVERGVRPGDTVALLLENSVWFPVAYYGVLLAGAVVCPLNPALPALLLRDQLAAAAVTAVVTSADRLPVLDEADHAALHLIVLIPAPDDDAALAPPRTVGLSEVLKAEPAASAVERRPDDLVHLLFTGGTTGRSKAVRVLQRNAMANIVQASCWRSCALPIVDPDGAVGLGEVVEPATAHAITPGRCRSIAIAPFFHAMGLGSMNNGVLQGQTVIVGGRFHPARYLDLARKHEVSAVMGSPPMFRALVAASDGTDLSLPHVRLASSGAAPIDRVTLERLRALFPNAMITEGYGLTEATMGLTFGPVSPPSEPAPFGTVGLPVFDTEIQIRTLEEPHAELATGEIGEVWARGPQITDGYHGHPELTAQQFTGDGWLRTGDLGRLDENGYLFLEGRAKDMLIYKGYNVYPQQLEEVLCTHPAVAQAAVVGVPSLGVGEIPVGFIVTRAGVRTDDGGDLMDDLTNDLMAYVADRVLPYARLRGLRVVDALPVSAAGKVLKNELRDAWDG